MSVSYTSIHQQLSALTQGIIYETANLANASALLYQELERINWAGFYKVEDGQLVLGPFQGRTACILIPLGKGVCGTAAAQDRVLRVPDVHKFEGHIACDSASRSEIVLPVHKNGKVWGVLDIDSPETDRFSPEDQAGLQEFVQILEQVL